MIGEKWSLTTSSTRVFLEPFHPIWKPSLPVEEIWMLSNILEPRSGNVRTGEVRVLKKSGKRKRVS
jgi:hypothetical protein